MTLTVAFRQPARAEFNDAAAWYAALQPKLGIDFIAEIERCVALAAEQPLRFRVIRNDIRRVVANRFPYTVYYRAETRRIVVLAVFHSSRDPTVWQRRS